MNKADASDWRNLPMPAVFDADFKAWLKSLSREARKGECSMNWLDLGPHAHSAYGHHSDRASELCFAVSKGKAPAVLPDDCTPDGFYLKAVAMRRVQVGIADQPFTPTPYERLSAFSQFLYRRMADRLAVAAGFKTKTSRASTLDDGLGGDLDDSDGLGDGLGEPESVDDGLGGGNGLEDLDDGLGGPDSGSRRLIYHAESESYVECDEFEMYDLIRNAHEDLHVVTGMPEHEAAFKKQQQGDDGLGDLGDGL